jgi:cell division protein FtsI (penicillin-binding protein 3)
MGTARRGARTARGGLARASRRRLVVLLGGFGVAFLLVSARLLSVQGVGSRAYEHIGTDQALRNVTLPALRGSILASDGDELAFSELRPTIFADPGEVTNVAGEARQLAPLLHQPVAALATDLAERTTYVVLAAATTPTVSNRVAALDLAGIGVEQEPVRFHPAGNLAAPLLGTLDAAGRGASGLEYEYNSLLAGHPGHEVVSVDPEGDPLPGGTVEQSPAIPGDDLLTTINEPLQYQAEQILRHTVATTKATSAIAIVMDRQTGDLLAVADIVAGPGGRPVESPRPGAIVSVYQPGSVMKVVTVAGALARHLITPDEVFTIPPALPVAGTLIHDAEVHPTEQLSVTGILAQSSNIGATEIAERLGPDLLYHYEAAFGFTHRTTVAFPGEPSGLVPRPDQFSGTTLATMSFGEAQAVTALQVVAAYNAIANGGVYVAPRLVTASVGPDGHEHLFSYPPPRRIVPASVAAAMTPMFEQVVSSGTGPNAQVKGYAIAGKTGTTNVLLPDGRYSNSVTDATFTGFYPAQDPVLSEIVVVKGSIDYGAEGAAPAFSAIARAAIADLGIPSDGPQPAPADTSVPTINGKVDTSLLGY